MQGIAQFLHHGGWVMYTNIICLAVVLTIIVERFIYLLFKGQINAKGLLEQLRKLIQANNVDRAIRLCGSTNAPLLRLAKSGLVQVHRGEEAIATSVEESLVETTPEVKKRISALWSLANIAVLIGLFGTVLGLAPTRPSGRRCWRWVFPRRCTTRRSGSASPSSPSSST